MNDSPGSDGMVIMEHHYGIGYLTMACPACRGFQYNLDVRWVSVWESEARYVWTARCQRCGHELTLSMIAAGDWPPNLEMGNPAWPRFQKLSAGD